MDKAAADHAGGDANWQRRFAGFGEARIGVERGWDNEKRENGEPSGKRFHDAMNKVERNTLAALGSQFMASSERAAPGTHL